MRKINILSSVAHWRQCEQEIRWSTIVFLGLLPFAARAQDSAFVRAIRSSSSPFTITNGRMTGAGADALARVAREHQFIMVGEDHAFVKSQSSSPHFGTTNSYELGTFLPEFAITNNAKAFGILVVVAKGTWNAYRPFGSKEEDKTKKYDPLTTDEYKIFDLKSLLEATGDSTWTFVDLRSIRAMAGRGGLRRLDPTAQRLLNSFDALVVVPEGHASVYFR